jgi:hypothetical protein
MQCTVHYTCTMRCTVHCKCTTQCTVHCKCTTQCTVHYTCTVRCCRHQLIGVFLGSFSHYCQQYSVWTFDRTHFVTVVSKIFTLEGRVLIPNHGTCCFEARTHYLHVLGCIVTSWWYSICAWSSLTFIKLLGWLSYLQEPPLRCLNYFLQEPPVYCI